MQVLSGPRGTCTNAGSAEMPGWNGRDGKNCVVGRSEEHTSELQSQSNLVCRLLLEKKNKEPVQDMAASLPAPAISPSDTFLPILILFNLSLCWPLCFSIVICQLVLHPSLTE